jgi:hypothetical protein
MSEHSAIEWLIFNIKHISRSNELYNGTELIECYHMIEVQHLQLLAVDAIQMENDRVKDALRFGAISGNYDADTLFANFKQHERRKGLYE